MRNITLLLLFLLASLFVQAQNGINLPEHVRVDSAIRAFMLAWDIKGGEVAITKNGKLIYNKGFGLSTQDSSGVAMPGNLYRIASVSKPITAIAIMKLVQDGKLSITDTVFGSGRLLDQPYYLDAITDSRVYQITVQNLLEHTAGWDRDKPCDGFGGCDPIGFPLHAAAVTGEPNPVGDSVLIKFLLQHPLNYNPGAVSAYSNIGYLILGKIIEKISRMPYADYVEHNIFAPLSICDIHLGCNLQQEKLPREVEYISPYTGESCYGTGDVVPVHYGSLNIEAMNAHGGWIATAADLTRLLLAVDGFATASDMLDSTILRLMYTPCNVNNGYAKGWAINRFNNRWHNGSLPGTSSFACITNNGYTWTLLFNSRNDRDGYWGALDKLPWDCIRLLPDNTEINLYAPNINVSNFTAIPINDSTVHLSWINGNGSNRLIIMTEDSVYSSYPIDGVTYISDSRIADNRAVVIYNGGENSCLVPNITPNKRYLISGFEYYRNKETANREAYKLGCNEVFELKVRTK